MPRGKKANSELDQKIAEKYYTSQQAQKELGVTKDKFNYYIKVGIIHPTPILGSNGYYNKLEIQAIQDKIQLALTTADIPQLEYRFATIEDLQQENRLASYHFGPKAYGSERVAARRRYLEKNPESTVHLYNHGLLVCSLNFIPLTHDAILKFREGERGWKFPDEKIMQFEAGQRLECIIIDMMVTTQAYRSQQERYAAYLIRRFSSDTLVTWAARGVDIKSIDSCGGTEQGRNILRHAGFTSIGVKKEDREIYHLDIDENDNRFLTQYKETLADWKSRH